MLAGNVIYYSFLSYQLWWFMLAGTMALGIFHEIQHGIFSGRRWRIPAQNLLSESLNKSSKAIIKNGKKLERVILSNLKYTQRILYLMQMPLAIKSKGVNWDSAVDAVQCHMMTKKGFVEVKDSIVYKNKKGAKRFLKKVIYTEPVIIAQHFTETFINDSSARKIFNGFLKSSKRRSEFIKSIPDTDVLSNYLKNNKLGRKAIKECKRLISKRENSILRKGILMHGSLENLVRFNDSKIGIPSTALTRESNGSSNTTSGSSKKFSSRTRSSQPSVEMSFS